VAIVANFSDLRKGVGFSAVKFIGVQNRKRKEDEALPVSRIFGVYDLGQNKVRERLSFRECSTLRDRWPKNGHLLAPGHRQAVLRVVGAGIYSSHDDKYVLELRAYPSRTEWQRAGFLKTRNDYRILYRKLYNNRIKL